MLGRNYTGRVRTLADSVNELTSVLVSGKSIVTSKQKVVLDGQSLGVMREILSAMRELTNAVHAANERIESIAHLPVVSLLGGGAEAELQKLVGNVDRLVKVADELLSQIR